jgi:glycosyltransferase involved in cell wall biosynthesis
MLSVVIPTYNRADYLPLAVDSALGQSGVQIEVVIVDDGSTDGTESVVGRQAALWGSRVRYVRQENAERSVARNNGLIYAHGDYVAFLDSDDLWQRDHARTCLEALWEDPVAVAAYGEYGLISADGRVIRDRVPRPAATGDSFRRDLCLKRLILHPTEVIVRRSALSSDSPFDPEIPGAEDWLFWLDLLRRGPFRSTGQRTAWMRVHPKGTFGDPDKFCRSISRAAEKVICTGMPAELGISAGRILAINRTHCAYAHYLAGHWPQAWRFLFQALRHYPKVLLERDLWQVLVRLCMGRTLSRGIREVRHRGSSTTALVADST